MGLRPMGPPYGRKAYVRMLLGFIPVMAVVIGGSLGIYYLVRAVTH